MQKCNQWLANGSCNFGDRCKFSHDGGGGVNQMRRAKALPTPKFGDTIILGHDLDIVALRGIMGQVTGEGVDGYTLVQLDVPETSLDSLLGQMAHMAAELASHSQSSP